MFNKEEKELTAEEFVLHYNIPMSLGMNHGWLHTVYESHRKDIIKSKQKIDDVVQELRSGMKEIDNRLDEIEKDQKLTRETINSLLKQCCLEPMPQNNEINSNEIPCEISSLKSENEELKKKVSELQKEVVGLKEENATLKSQLLYLWELIKTFFTKHYKVISNNFNSFFYKSKEPTNGHSNEPENTKFNKM